MPTSESAREKKKLRESANSSILKSWVRAQTTEALAFNLERLVDEPKGWKKDQREVLITEGAFRLHEYQQKFKEIAKAHTEYRNALAERRHGGVAQDEFYRKVMVIMGWDD